jgi:hypothetical protein
MLQSFSLLNPAPLFKLALNFPNLIEIGCIQLPTSAYILFFFGVKFHIIAESKNDLQQIQNNHQTLQEIVVYLIGKLNKKQVILTSVQFDHLIRVDKLI